MKPLRRIFRPAAALAASLLLAANAHALARALAEASPPAASAASAAARPAAAAPCRIAGLRSDVECGVVRRPLDPQRRGGLQVDIHFVVVPALARHKLPDPVFLLAGGPGQSAMALAPNLMPLFLRLNQRRDIVFVDQRGTGRSAPLACDDEPPAALGGGLDGERQVAVALRCRDRLAALPYVGGPGGLRHFTTALAVQDFDAVRRRLGAPRVNLVGGSYGTRVALEWLRQSPGRVRRSVLDGTAPADMQLPVSLSQDSQAALEALFAACRAEPACAAAHPDLAGRWRTLLASLPREVRVADPLSGRITPVQLSRDAVLALVRTPLYSPAVAAALPRAIDDAADGRFEALAGLQALQGARPQSRPAVGMHFSVVCAEDLPMADHPPQEPGRDFGRSSLELYRQVCAEWPRGEPPAGFGELAAAESAVLLLSGGLDPATPPRHGERVAQRLGALARHVVVPQAGHGVLGTGCGRELLQRFIEAESDAAALAVDARCLEALPRPPFFELPRGRAAGTSPLPR